MATTTGKFKFAGIQLAVGADKAANIANAQSKIVEAAKNGARVITLPECFNSPYGNQYFPAYAEPLDNSPTLKAIRETAIQNGVYIIAGSIPERDSKSQKMYNTSVSFNPKGEIIGIHRKVHLFDIDVPGKIRFVESESLTAGNTPTILDTEFCKVGVAICYDIRFPELAQIYAEQGCSLLVYPGAFNMVTGPAHWELLQRARAIDNQLFVAGVSPARDVNATYTAWGHSTVVNPWGEIVSTTDENPSTIYADIDLSKVAEMRNSIPTLKQKRRDIYTSPKLIQ
jgi:omega-amidase